VLKRNPGVIVPGFFQPGSKRLTMTALFAMRLRYVYRRIHVLLRREDSMVKVKVVDRIYCEMRLQLCNSSSKQKVNAKL
jgi:hypothetical protein